MSAAVLAADVGGTKTNLALVPASTRGWLGEPTVVHSYASAEFHSFESIIDLFRAGPAAAFWNTVRGATIGYAGPVSGGRAAGSNVPWGVDAASLARHLGLPRVGLVNDLVATGYGVAAVRSEGLASLLSGTSDSEANAAIVAAGTGLGECILARVGGDFIPIPSEGGHADFAPRTDVEVEIWRELRSRFGRVSVERLLSGPGLAHIGSFMHARRGLGDAHDGLGDAWRAHEAEAGTEERLPGIVSRNGLDRSCPACAEALDLFVGIYGSEAANTALRCVARGGIYLGGGIAPRILPALRGPIFERAFRDKAPHEDLLAAIPVWVLLDDKTALWGAARHAAMSLS